MNGVHDMGGMHALGPIVIEVNEPLFHPEWDGRARAMMTVAPFEPAIEITGRCARWLRHAK